MTTNKQQAFIYEYLKDFNATRAALDAGYSKKTAYSIGQENLKKPEIAEAIRQEIESRSMSADEVLTRLSDIARGDITNLMDVSTMGFNINLITKDEDGNNVINPKSKLIKKIKQKVTTYLAKKEDGEDKEIVETEIELYSAHEALRDLGKHLGIFKDEKPEPPNVNVTIVMDSMLEKIYGNKEQD